jgi:prepilin-type N-terminal cleavage/methylation domain-containing protein
MRNERGFSLAEVLVALLILAVVITTTLAMFTERQRRMRQASETMLAYQVLANEVEYWRRVPFSFIDDPANLTFQTPTTLLAPLAPYVALVNVDKTNDDVRQVTFSIRWATGKREAKLSIARGNLGGTPNPGDNPLW